MIVSVERYKVPIHLQYTVAAFDKGLADEQSVFANLFCSWRCLIFSSCIDLPMRALWPDRQCCQGAEVSAAKRLDFLSKISTYTGITINWSS
jgi:hypothetical protein